MIKHFTSRAAAITELTAKGFRLTVSGNNWISADRTCVATIYPVAGGDTVAVSIWLI